MKEKEIENKKKHTPSEKLSPDHRLNLSAHFPTFKSWQGRWCWEFEKMCFFQSDEKMMKPELRLQLPTGRQRSAFLIAGGVVFNPDSSDPNTEMMQTP